jgi:hypothetical protein
MRAPEVQIVLGAEMMCNLAKVGVESSNLFARSKISRYLRWLRNGPRWGGSSLLDWTPHSHHRWS